MSAAVSCGWELPRPKVRADSGVDTGATDASIDAPRDSASAQDALVELPQPRDLPAETTIDTGVVDTGADTITADTALTDITSEIDTSVPDVVMGECVSGTRRPCYTGPAASRLRGLCRDGVNVCSAAGSFGATCEGEVVPDCRGRACGGDDCGGACGTCPMGTVCNDAGRCVTRVCGMANFTVVCADGSRCPANSACMPGGRCLCNSGFIGIDCAGIACGASCAYPNWGCQPQSFCGTGESICVAGARCPRHAGCDMSGRCVCDSGFVAVTCSGVRCDMCPGVNYRCSPGALP